MSDWALFLIIMCVAPFVLGGILVALMTGLDALRKWLVGKMR